MNRFFEMKECERCGGGLKVRTMSRFNEDILCMECAEKERQHPHYKKAAAREAAEVARGNLNYEGLYAGRKYPFGERTK